MNDQSAEGTATRLPPVTLKAFGHGRELRFDALGVPAVLICVARETSDQPPPVTRAIRDRYPDASQVLVISLADVRGIPKLLRKVVEQLMKSSYTKAVENLQPGRAPEDYVLIVPDWDGEVLGPLGVENTKEQIAIAVLSRTGDVVSLYQGAEPAAETLRALEPVI
jgi:hypothetical protein